MTDALEPGSADCAKATTSSVELAMDSSRAPDRFAVKWLNASRRAIFGSRACAPQAAVPVTTATTAPPARSRGRRTGSSRVLVPGGTPASITVGGSLDRARPRKPQVATRVGTPGTAEPLGAHRYRSVP